MKTVTLLYFAAIRELAATATEELEVPDAVETLGDLVLHLGTRKPSLEAALRAVRLAKNETFAGLGEALHDGDVIALIPPVQGG